MIKGSNNVVNITINGVKEDAADLKANKQTIKKTVTEDKKVEKDHDTSYSLSSW